jgi:hypothetical protein
MTTEEKPPPGTPIIQRNLETDHLRIIWPEGKPVDFMISGEALSEWIADRNDLVLLARKSLAMLEDYRAHRPVPLKRWEAVQRLRRKLKLTKEKT